VCALLAPTPPRARSTEGLQHNVVLIRELNANISRIIFLYNSIGAQQRPGGEPGGGES